MEEFHFIRPLWLLMIPISIVTALYFRRRKTAQAPINQAVAAEFIPFLTVGTVSHKRRSSGWLLLCIGWIITAIALAGPSWRKLPQPTEQKVDGLVILLDLSLSMLAEDIKPSRAERARHKISDLLDKRDEGLTGLIAYAGSAHTVAPLTDDIDTISGLLESLTPNTMPTQGSDAAAAVSLATRLFKNSQLPSGRIVLITDGIQPTEHKALVNTALNANLTLSVIGVGSSDGAPIPLSNGQFLKSPDGAIVIPRLKESILQSLAADAGGHYARITVDESDLKRVLAKGFSQRNMLNETTRTDQRTFDLWVDEAYWLTLLLIPLVLLIFRRGLLFCLLYLLPCSMLTLSGANHAWSNESAEPSASNPPTKTIWQTPDQAGQQLFDQGDFSSAAQQFDSTQWQSAANYRAKNYQAALEASQQHSPKQLNSDSARARWHYNRGNSLAQLHRFKEALEAYDEALQLQPKHDDAQFNRDIVQSLLDRQEQQQEQQGQDGQEGQEDQEGQESSEGQQGGDNQNQNQQTQNQNNQQQNNQQQNGQEQQQAQNSGEQNSQQHEEDELTEPEQANRQRREKEEEEEKKEKEEEHQMRAQQEANEQDTEQEKEEASVAQTETNTANPEQEYIDRWLKQLPDTPGTLLKNKFYLQSLESQREAQRRGEAAPKQEVYW